MDRADAVVIGAGVIGSSIALELARAGVQTVVLDKGAVGGGSTGASSACIRLFYSNAAAVMMAYESLRVWQDWENHIGFRPDEGLARFHPVGSVFVFPEDRLVDQALALVESVGAPARIETVESLRKLYPAFELGTASGGPEVRRVLYEPESGYVDQPDLAAKNLAAAACAAGAVFRPGERVLAIDTGRLDLRGRPRRVRGVETDRGRIDTPVVVNAAGPWSFQVNGMAGVDLPLAPHRHQTISIPLLRPGGALPAIPMCGDMAGKVYFRPEPSAGRVQVGSLDPDDDRDRRDDPDDFPVQVDGEFFHRTRERFAARFPEVAGFAAGEGPRGVCGLYDVHLPDWYPVLDRSDVEGFYLAVGTSGAWFKGAPVIGQVMAALVLMGANHDSQPLQIRLPRTGNVLDVGFFRRNRPPIKSELGGGGVIG